jgi:segregation and condensation protein A
VNETYDAVLGHLLFHKSLISEQDGGERISKYMSMLQEIELGQHLALRDPLEKSIAAAFELVLEKQMDPWDINLAEFTRMYMEKVKDDGYVNFVTAGKLVSMAWSILKMQSERVLTSAEPPQEEFPFADWDLGPTVYGEDGSTDFTQAVIGGRVTPLQEAIRRQGKRAVTLMELMDAFDEARQEAERHVKLMALREEARKVRMTLPRGNIHSEDLFEDLDSTWARITRFNGSPIPITNLWDGDSYDRVTVFTSVLFLAHLQRVRIWQKKLPYGEIFVQRLAEQTELSSEELAGFSPAAAKMAGRSEAVA